MIGLFSPSYVEVRVFFFYIIPSVKYGVLTALQREPSRIHILSTHQLVPKGPDFKKELYPLDVIFYTAGNYFLYYIFF